MPKKTENTKAVAARERKKNAKEAEIARKQKEEEDAYWKDDDKQVLKKQQKKVKLSINPSIFQLKIIVFTGGAGA